MGKREASRDLIGVHPLPLGTPSTRISMEQMLRNTSSCSSVTLVVHPLECLPSGRLRTSHLAVKEALKLIHSHESISIGSDLGEGMGVALHLFLVSFLSEGVV